MKIKYKLEVHYFGTDENQNKIDRYDTFIYDSEDSIENRRKVFDDYKKFSEVFEDAEKFGKLKFNWSEILEKNIKEFHIPSMNIYYTETDFDSEEDVVLLGNLIESFDENMTELEDELKLYEKLSIPFEYEIITDLDEKKYKVLKDSLIINMYLEKIKNVC